MLKRDLPSRAYSLLGGYANMQLTTNVEEDGGLKKKKKKTGKRKRTADQEGSEKVA